MRAPRLIALLAGLALLSDQFAGPGIPARGGGLARRGCRSPSSSRRPSSSPTSRATVGTGVFIRYEDWAKAKPLQQQFLSLYPGYAEPNVDIIVDGAKKRYREKLHMYVAEARFVLAKPPASINLRALATLPFAQQLDPAIKHRLITAADAGAAERGEGRAQPEPAAPLVRGPARHDLPALDLQARGPAAGRHRARQQDPRGRRRKISDTLEFDGELTVLSPAEVGERGLAKLTGLDTPCGRRHRAEHLLRQPGDAVRQADRDLPAASERPEQDRRHRLHVAGGRIEHPGEAQGIRPGAGAAEPGAGPGPGRQEHASIPATRSAPACRSMRATRSRRSPRSSSGADPSVAQRRFSDGRRREGARCRCRIASFWRFCALTWPRPADTCPRLFGRR